jgi:hypothetical protein
VPEIPASAWQTLDPSQIRYVYVSGLKADVGALPLAYEPGIYGQDRFVLLTNGQICQMTAEQILDATIGEGGRQ